MYSTTVETSNFNKLICFKEYQTVNLLTIHVKYHVIAYYISLSQVVIRVRNFLQWMRLKKLLVYRYYVPRVHRYNPQETSIIFREQSRSLSYVEQPYELPVWYTVRGHCAHRAEKNISTLVCIQDTVCPGLSHSHNRTKK